jgi:hypothetical protein
MFGPGPFPRASPNVERALPALYLLNPLPTLL